MSEQAYPQWETCVNEHIIRSVVARFSLEKFGEKEYHRIIDDEKVQGFFYIESICKKLEQYENNRDKYKTFEEFYPEIVNMFKVLSESKLDKDFYKIVFGGPINNAFLMDNPIVIITPTAEENKAIQEKINSYVKMIKENIEALKGAEIITDIDALNRDLGENTILAYGTMEGNLWLAKYKDTFPFKISKDRITMDKEYMAKDQRFISAVPNPMNTDNALVVYTAQQAKDIEGINNAFHGPTDYILLEWEDEIASGDYTKENGKWSFK